MYNDRVAIYQTQKEVFDLIREVLKVKQKLEADEFTFEDALQLIFYAFGENAAKAWAKHIKKYNADPLCFTITDDDSGEYVSLELWGEKNE